MIDQGVDVFGILADIVREWRERGRITTTAGLKPPLLDALGGVTEQDLGFETWRDLIEAAVRAGAVRTERLATGHVAVLLPDESVDVLPPGPRRAESKQQGLPAEVDPETRLKADIWIAFIDWRQHHRRLFDLSTARALMYPIDETGAPAWVNEPRRFAVIEPISFEQQKEWIIEWARTLSSVNRDALIASIAPGNAVGSFRRELVSRGLASVWRAELQKRALEYVRDWAKGHKVDWKNLIDHQHRPRPTDDLIGRLSHRATPSHSKAPSSMTRSSESDLERLRLTLHRIIDCMSLAELAALPIRAEHLLGAQQV